MKHSAESIFLLFGGIGFAIMWVLSYFLDHISLIDMLLFAGLGLAIATCGIVMGQRIMERKRR
jgi:hypothetical protein